MSPWTYACVLAVVTACAKPGSMEAPMATAAPTPSATSSSTMSASPVAAAGSATAAASPTDASGGGTVDCRATSADGPLVLTLQWDRNTAKGTLETTKAGAKSTFFVIAELYKGLVLVDDASSKPPRSGKLATMTTEGKKTIRLGARF